MMFQFYFKKMGSSETLKDLSQRKLSDLAERFVGANGLMRVTFQTEKNAQRICCHLQGHNGQTFQASASSDNMYANLDVVAHKLEAQLMRVKTRAQKSKTRFTPPYLHLVGDDERPASDLDIWEETYESESSLRHYH